MRINIIIIYGGRYSVDNTTDYYISLLKLNENKLDTKVPFTHKFKTNNKVKNISLGRILVNSCFPDDFPFVDEPIDKKRCTQLINEIANKYEPAIASSTLTKLNKIAFDIATINPISFNIDSFNVPPELLKRSKQILDPNLEPAQFVKNIGILGQEYLDWLKVNDDGLYDIVTSGAKLAPIDIGVILFAKGPAVGIDGKISKPILGCVNNGFNLEDFYKSADQSRNVLTIRSLGSSEPGALAR